VSQVVAKDIKNASAVERHAAVDDGDGNTKELITRHSFTSQFQIEPYKRTRDYCLRPQCGPSAGTVTNGMRSLSRAGTVSSVGSFFPAGPIVALDIAADLGAGQIT